MPIANEDRERARLWLEMFAPGMPHDDRVQWIKANIEDLARSYAEVREEAEAYQAYRLSIGENEGHIVCAYINGVRYVRAADAHRAGMEEAARIACGPRHDGRGVSKRGQLHTDACVAIRAAMKEGKP